MRVVAGWAYLERRIASGGGSSTPVLVVVVCVFGNHFLFSGLLWDAMEFDDRSLGKSIDQSVTMMSPHAARTSQSPLNVSRDMTSVWLLLSIFCIGTESNTSKVRYLGYLITASPKPAVGLVNITLN